MWKVQDRVPSYGPGFLIEQVYVHGAVQHDDILRVSQAEMEEAGAGVNQEAKQGDFSGHCSRVCPQAGPAHRRSRGKSGPRPPNSGPGTIGGSRAPSSGQVGGLVKYGGRQGMM